MFAVKVVQYDLTDVPGIAKVLDDELARVIGEEPHYRNCEWNHEIAACNTHDWQHQNGAPDHHIEQAQQSSRLPFHTLTRLFFHRSLPCLHSKISY